MTITHAPTKMTPLAIKTAGEEEYSTQIPTPINGDLSLYFHLPFCTKKCDYCHFFVLPHKSDYQDRLLLALLKEIDLKKDLLKSSTIRSLYFGGGTPALVGPAFIEKIFQKLSTYISLKDIEITLELNPENSNLSLLKAYRTLGINRLSIGVQSLDDHLLKTLSRSHDASRALDSIDEALEAGFTNISCDLMYDLPHQGLRSWEKTLSTLSEKPITHLSLYNLSIEKNTVFYKYRNRLLPYLPSEETSTRMLKLTEETFEAKGFKAYEISAFSKPGYYSKHNVGYWLQRNHLGFGPSAFSLVDQRRFQNVAHLNRYEKGLNNYPEQENFSETLSSLAFLRESLSLNLRLHQGVNLSYFEKRFGEICLSTKKIIDKLKHEHLLKEKGNHLQLTYQGRLFHDYIASELVLID